MPRCKAFFKAVKGLSTFFSKSTKRTHLLVCVIASRLSRASPSTWSLNAKLVLTVSMHRFDLLAIICVIVDGEESWDSDSAMKTDGHELWFSKTTLYFIIIVYEG